MENNLNKKGIEKYCNVFCEKLVANYFESNQVITGKDILELQEIRQINLFVIRHLLSEWTKEASRIRSPYFDYEDPEVKGAFKEFMNILSRHIAIEREDFLPLLKKATHDTLLLIFSPYDYYMHLIHGPAKKQLSLKDLQRTSKYVKVNHNLLQALISKVEATGQAKISKEEAGNLLNEVFHNIQESPADIDEYIEKFSRVEPLTEATIYGEPSHERRSETTEENINLNDVREDNRATINDKHSGEQKPTLADIHRKQKIESIRKNISINQRFMFINVLFDGNEDAYNRTLDYLEGCNDRSAAFDYLTNQHPNWDIDSEEVGEFIELVEKRVS